jgi:hypothetical protein
MHMGPSTALWFPEVALGAFGLSARNTYPTRSSGCLNAARGSKAATETWTSMIGLAAKPGTAVEPTWSILSAMSPSRARSSRASSANCSGQAGS